MKLRLISVLSVMALSVMTTPVNASEAPAKANFPETDIFLFDVSWDGEPTLSKVRNVTDRSGYDNQPSFTPDSQTFLFSRGDDYQTDVYEYDLSDESVTQITDTKTSEFSPVATPDNKVISFVTDGPGAKQNIAVIMRDKPESMDMLLTGKSLREPVGYYAWDHANDNVLFWSRYGSNVTLANTIMRRLSMSQATQSRPRRILFPVAINSVSSTGKVMEMSGLRPLTRARNPCGP